MKAQNKQRKAREPTAPRGRDAKAAPANRKGEIDTGFGHLFAELIVCQEAAGVLIGVRANGAVTEERRDMAARKLRELSGPMLPRLRDAVFRIFMRKEGDVQGPGFDVTVNCPNGEQGDVPTINKLIPDVMAALTADVLPEATFLVGNNPEFV